MRGVKEPSSKLNPISKLFVECWRRSEPETLVQDSSQNPRPREPSPHLFAALIPSLPFFLFPGNSAGRSKPPADNSAVQYRRAFHRRQAITDGLRPRTTFAVHNILWSGSDPGENAARIREGIKRDFVEGKEAMGNVKIGREPMGKLRRGVKVELWKSISVSKETR